MESLSPGDSGGPLTPSALEKSQKQTVQRKQAQSGAGSAGLSSQVPGPQPRLCPQRPGWSEAPGRRSMSRHADPVG
jgi:hypothetical protein